MPLTAEQTKSLIRLQVAVTELQNSLDGRQASNAPLRAAHRQLTEIVEQIMVVLEAGDAAAAAQLRRLIDSAGDGFAGMMQRLATIAGWLKGAVEAEVLERRLTMEARAYAEARMRAERPGDLRFAGKRPLR